MRISRAQARPRQEGHGMHTEGAQGGQWVSQRADVGHRGKTQRGAQGPQGGCEVT